MLCIKYSVLKNRNTNIFGCEILLQKYLKRCQVNKFILQKNVASFFHKKSTKLFFSLHSITEVTGSWSNYLKSKLDEKKREGKSVFFFSKKLFGNKFYQVPVNTSDFTLRFCVAILRFWRLDIFFLGIIGRNNIQH